MYIIESTNQKEASYMKAVKIASEIGSKVIDENTGMVKWEPAPEITEKKIKRYRERKSAYDAYQELKSNNKQGN